MLCYLVLLQLGHLLVAVLLLTTQGFQPVVPRTPRSLCGRLRLQSQLSPSCKNLLVSPQSNLPTRLSHDKICNVDLSFDAYESS